MKNLVLDEILNEEEEEQPPTLTLHNPHKITRCASKKTIKTVSQNKIYKLVFDKPLNLSHMAINAASLLIYNSLQS